MSDSLKTIDELFNLAVNAKQAAVNSYVESDDMTAFMDNSEIMTGANLILDKYREEWKADLERLMAQERLDQAKFYYGTLSDHDLRELDRTTLNTWRMDIAQLEQLIAAGEEEK